MSETFASMCLKVEECLKAPRYSTANGACTASTLVDSLLTDEPDQFFKGGIIFFLSGSLAGKTAIVTNFATATGTISFETQTNAPSIGDQYALVQANYPREAIVSAINRALNAVGPFRGIYEDPTFLTVSNQEKYVLPDDVANVQRVFVASNATEPFNWMENNGWYEQNKNLYFDQNPPSISSRRIRLFYHKAHDRVYLDSDPISDDANSELIAWTAAYYAALVRSGYAENSEPYVKELITYAQQKMIEYSRFPVERWRKAVRKSNW
jgi:hypothetical protein